MPPEDNSGSFDYEHCDFRQGFRGILEGVSRLPLYQVVRYSLRRSIDLLLSYPLVTGKLIGDYIFDAA